ncbi:MAG: metal-sensitive transcriptional regulator [Chloroflexi bacterium]|nr:metal-sensitive transcriptional regulator [Chloroflexota bacterium]
MDPEEERKLLARLARIEGQVRGLRKMLEEHRACEDVLTQLLAARSGLEQAGIMVLERHLDECVLLGAEVSPEARERIKETLRQWSRHTSHSG